MGGNYSGGGGLFLDFCSEHWLSMKILYLFFFVEGGWVFLQKKLVFEKNCQVLFLKRHVV